MKTTRFLVTGKVQGVGYRRFVQKRAAELGVNGWARNLIDGRVEVWAQGDLNPIRQLGERLREGPAFSVVEHLESHEIDAEKMTDFQIKPDGDPR